MITDKATIKSSNRSLFYTYTLLVWVSVCMYPVNISIARNIALLPLTEVGSDGMMSHAHVTLGA